GVSLLHFINGLRRGRQWSLHILVEPRTPYRSFRSRTCEWSTAARSFSMASTSTSTPMRSSPCSAPTVPANRRQSRSSKGSRSASSDHGKWRPRQLLSHLSDFYRHYVDPWPSSDALPCCSSTSRPPGSTPEPAATSTTSSTG